MPALPTIHGLLNTELDGFLSTLNEQSLNRPSTPELPGQRMTFQTAVMRANWFEITKGCVLRRDFLGLVSPRLWRERRIIEAWRREWEQAIDPVEWAKQELLRLSKEFFLSRRSELRKRGSNGCPDLADPVRLFPLTGKMINESDDVGDERLRLGFDPVFTCPWNPNRLEDALSGKSLNPGPWIQDDNHRITMWLPLRIGWVSNGHHSIAAGIVRQEGEVRPTYIADLSVALAQYHLDGFRLVDQNAIRGKLEGEVAARVWFLGQVIVKSFV